MFSFLCNTVKVTLMTHYDCRAKDHYFTKLVIVESNAPMNQWPLTFQRWYIFVLSNIQQAINLNDKWTVIFTCWSLKYNLSIPAPAFVHGEVVLTLRLPDAVGALNKREALFPCVCVTAGWRQALKVRRRSFISLNHCCSAPPSRASSTSFSTSLSLSSSGAPRAKGALLSPGGPLPR